MSIPGRHSYRARGVAAPRRAHPALQPLLPLLAVLLLVAGCGRVDTLRLGHANSGTPVEWPAAAISMELPLRHDEHGRPWLAVSVDGHPPVPFLLQASAGAIALTGANPEGFGPGHVGRARLSRPLLPGIDSGRLVKQRRLALGELVLGDQSLLLVELGDWPHGRPGGGAAGVIGYDLLRRFAAEIALDSERLILYRRGTVPEMPADSRRLVVLERRPYFEAWLELEAGLGRWVRLQFEPAARTGLCLDEPSFAGSIRLGGERVAAAAEPCEPGTAVSSVMAARDGVLGAGGLAGLVITVDFERGRIGFSALNSTSELRHDGY